jgi:hypothetical protein
MPNFLAQPEGGELIEVLVLLIIMALSALGSVLKGRKTSKKPTPPKPVRAKPPAEGQSVPEQEILQRPDRPRVPKTFDFRKPPDFKSQPEISKRPVSKARTLAMSGTEPEVVAVPGDLETSEAQGLLRRAPVRWEPVDFQLDRLSLEDIRKAIVLREVLGPPRALQDLNNPL